MNELERLKNQIQALTISDAEKIKLLINLQIAKEIDSLTHEINSLRRLIDKKC
jgi:hypothetical protein